MVACSGVCGASRSSAACLQGDGLTTLGCCTECDRAPSRMAISLVAASWWSTTLMATKAPFQRPAQAGGPSGTALGVHADCSQRG